MTNDLWNAVWERVRSGEPAMVIGPHLPPSVPSGVQVLRVSCEAAGGSGGPLAAVRRQIAQVLGDEPQPSGPTPGQLEAGLRRRLLGDLPGPALEAQFVEACNRLADQSHARVVLVFEAIEAADAATIESLSQILRRRGWLRLPLLLIVHGRPRGPITMLIEVMRQAYGEAAVIDGGGEGLAREDAAPSVWAALPPDVLRVLRAGSVCGATFDAEMVAGLLHEPLESVLERLQEAADAGVPLADRGEGRFSLPAPAIEALQSRILPSLLNFWHVRLAEMLSGIQPSGQTRQPVQPPEGASMVELGSGAAPPVARPAMSYAGVFEPAPGAPPAEQTTPQVELPPPLTAVPERHTEPPPMAGRPVPGPHTPQDQARAATHLQAAGRQEAAVDQYLAATREAAARGDVRRAYDLAVRALQVLEGLPASPRRALLRTQLLLEMGGLQWHGALLGAPFTLREALASLEAARAALPEGAPAEIEARLAATTAGVCYDLGDSDSLQRALEALTQVSRRLLSASEPLLAASLLNDQAAVYVRLGDPVRAAHLLEESRRLYEGRLQAQPDEIVAVEELADTRHLLARLPLHAPIRPGREMDAYVMSLEHARAAELAYRRLGQHGRLARVWETMGRLESRWGQYAAARERLSAAVDLQRQVGDVIGLARSTAALANVCSATGRLSEAVALLADSVTLNFQKGSPLGLAVNRRSLDDLVCAAAREQGPEGERLRDAVAEVERRLAQAEAILGRMVLPGVENGTC
jgi:tetratricopeptide (TPR) repeat protein